MNTIKKAPKNLYQIWLINEKNKKPIYYYKKIYYLVFFETTYGENKVIEIFPIEELDINEGFVDLSNMYKTSNMYEQDERVKTVISDNIDEFMKISYP